MTENEWKLARELAQVKMANAQNTVALMQYQFNEAQEALKALGEVWEDPEKKEKDEEAS